VHVLYVRCRVEVALSHHPVSAALDVTAVQLAMRAYKACLLCYGIHNLQQEYASSGQRHAATLEHGQRSVHCLPTTTHKSSALLTDGCYAYSHILLVLMYANNANISILSSHADILPLVPDTLTLEYYALVLLCCRELRSIVGSVLLGQLRACWHAHNVRVQAESYLFGLVVDIIRTALR
jgi:hypothetical protein